LRVCRPGQDLVRETRFNILFICERLHHFYCALLSTRG
jgi:hypothetical protein